MSVDRGLAETVRAFVLSQFVVADPALLTDDTSLIDSGVVDSTGMLDVITWLEEEFHLKVLDQEMVPSNLDSVASLAAYITRKRAAQG